MRRVFSSREVGKLVGADPSSVNRWIDSGRLKAYRTPGGHRRVLYQDLLVFLQGLGIPLPEELRPATLSLLLVDSDEQHLRSLRKGLARMDRSLNIQTCASGIEALILLGARRPDVILLDLLAPGIDGLEACRRIKECPETSAVMVIACSSRPASQAESRAREAGASAYLVKPVKPAALFHLIRPGQSVV
jgi:excisionase family DNA binding protein